MSNNNTDNGYMCKFHVAPVIAPPRHSLGRWTNGLGWALHPGSIYVFDAYPWLKRGPRPVPPF